MKYNRIFAAAAAILLIASCNPDKGPVGKASAGFASAEFESGLGTEYIYVPIVAEGEASAFPRTVTVEVQDYDGAFAAKEDVDYMITSKEIVIASAESSPSIEIKIVNPEDADELRFALALKGVESSSETVSQTLVKCAKSELDRVCGTYNAAGENDGEAFSETWTIVNDGGQIGIRGVLGETQGYLAGEYEDGVITIELGGDNMTGAYNFNGIGPAYVGPYFGYVDGNRYKIAGGSLVGKVSEDFSSIEWQIAEPYGIILAVFDYSGSGNVLGVFKGPFYINNNTITKQPKK